MLPLDWSVNCTVKGALPEVGLALKLAVGAPGAAEVTWIVTLLLSDPPLPVTVNITV